MKKNRLTIATVGRIALKPIDRNPVPAIHSLPTASKRKLQEMGFKTMAAEGMSIGDAAKELGVSTRTIRRFIKAGKLKAALIQGNFGPEYRIPEIPEDLRKAPPEKETEAEETVATEEVAAVQPVVQTIPPPQPAPETPDNVLNMLKDLQEKNMALAAQLGVATERIRNLENKVKLIDAPASIAPPKKSFWQRFLALFRG
jgi:MerR family transcriptional regulator, copper efflux regulator